MGNSDLPEAMGIANWECSTLKYLFSKTFFLVRVAYSCAADRYIFVRVTFEAPLVW